MAATTPSSITVAAIVTTEILPNGSLLPTGYAVTEQMWWYATRAAGLMTWLTAIAAVLIGLALSLRLVRSRTGAWLVDLHRFLGGISALFLIAHVGALFAASNAELTARELFIPGEATWEPGAFAWGIVAAYALVVVEITSLLRKRIRRRIWWVVHALSFVTVGAGTYHAWMAGSDVRNPIAWMIAGAGTVMVIGLIALRLQRHQQEDDPTGLHLVDDHQSLLLEMRQRLEALPVPEAQAGTRFEVDPAAELPQRAAPAAQTPDQPEAPPFDGVAADPTTAPPTAPLPEPMAEQASGPGPFDAGLLGGDALELGGQVTAHPTPPPEIDPTPPATQPPTEPPPYPFEATPNTAPGLTPPPDFSSLPPPAPVTAPADLFSAATPEEARNQVGIPFNPVNPSPSSISVPVDDLDPVPAPSSAPAPSASPAQEPPESPPAGPPPLPVDAVDPETGEPDEAAYTEWLKEWLVFAESYGDTAPDDPSRV